MSPFGFRGGQGRPQAAIWDARALGALPRGGLGCGQFVSGELHSRPKTLGYSIRRGTYPRRLLEGIGHVGREGKGGQGRCCDSAPIAS